MIKVGVQDGPRISLLEYPQATTWSVEDDRLVVSKAKTPLATFKVWAFVMKGDAQEAKA